MAPIKAAQRKRPRPIAFTLAEIRELEPLVSLAVECDPDLTSAQRSALERALAKIDAAVEATPAHRSRP